MTVTEAELASLAASHDIISLGMLADEARRARHGARTTFVRVADVSSQPGAPSASPPGAGEIRIVGSPTSRVAAIERVKEVVAQADGVPVSASPADLEELAGREGDAGAARSIMRCRTDLSAEAPFDQMKDAHRSIEEVNIAGLALARLTINRLPAADAPPLLKQIGALQYAVAVIRAFAPLPRHVNPAVPTTGYEDVRRVALARLFLGNVPSIQVDWSLYGPKLAQVALTVGADDVDGVSAADDLSEGPRRAPLEEIRRNIRAAGFQPVERNGRFELLDR